MKTKVGILDWGIGGMGVYSSLRAKGQTCDVVYFSDSGSTPYGKIPEQELRIRFEIVGSYLKQQGCAFVLVACNAASAAMKFETESFGGIPFHSIIPSAIKAVRNNLENKLGVIGGVRTIESGIYQKEMKGKNIKFVSAQPLSALVENGELDGEKVELQVQKVLNSFPDIECLLLACTHYPALNPVILRLAPHLLIIDPAETMVTSFIFPKGNSILEFRTTGNLDQSIKSSLAAFKIKIPKDAAARIDI